MNTITQDHPAHPEHKHHAIWRKYTEALLRGEILHVQWRISEKWHDLNKPAWDSANDYRIAPKLIRIVVGDVENWCPEPDGGTFFPALYGDLVVIRWRGDLGYSNREAAIYVSRALRGDKLPPWGEA